MEAYTAFVWTYGIVKLYSVTYIYLYLTFVINPRHTESYNSVRFNQALYQ